MKTATALSTCTNSELQRHIEQAAFVARWLACLAAAKRSGHYVEASAALDKCKRV